MQDTNELNMMKLEQLNQRLAEIDAERDSIRQQLKALKSSLAKDTVSDFWSYATVVAVSLVAFVSYLPTGVFHDAQSNITKQDQAEVSAMSAGQIARSEPESATNHTSPSSASKANSRFSRAKTASQKQWGPLLVMPGAVGDLPTSGFDPVLKAQQKNLLTLGFDLGEADGFKGARTRQAIAEFRALYLSDSEKQLKDADLAVIMETYTNLARSDAARYGIDHGVVAAIRLSSVHTGVDFAYLMKLAATESNFEPESQAATSSATGLYQFTHDTWLNTLKKHGYKYGVVADYAKHIEYYKSWSGYQRPILRNKAIYEHLLELRKNPRLAAIMAAEEVLDSEQRLAQELGREPNETDLYLSHFLGTDDAITFLQSLQQSPDTHAVDLFPEAASSNHRIFHPETCAPRTVNEVYALFGAKLSNRRFALLDTRQTDQESENLQASQDDIAINKPATDDQWQQGRAL